MIRLCPYCGRNLITPLTCGITTCDNCNRIFESSSYHKILSMAWMVRRWHVEEPYYFQHKFGFSEQEIDIVYKYVVEEGYCHDELVKALDKIDLDFSI